MHVDINWFTMVYVTAAHEKNAIVVCLPGKEIKEKNTDEYKPKYLKN